MKKSLFLTIALLCAVAQGAWATDYNVSNETELRGAIGNGAYAYYDTTEVGKTAAAYFKALADQDAPKAEETDV